VLAAAAAAPTAAAAAAAASATRAAVANTETQLIFCRLAFQKCKSTLQTSNGKSVSIVWDHLYGKRSSESFAPFPHTHAPLASAPNKTPPPRRESAFETKTAFEQLAQIP
jgi:hypothetical protein